MAKTQTATLAAAIKRSRPDVYEKIKAFAEKKGMKVGDFLAEVTERYMVYGETYPAWVGLAEFVDEIDWNNITPDAMKAAIFLNALAFNMIMVQTETISRLMGTYIAMWKDIILPLSETLRDIVTAQVETVALQRERIEEIERTAPPPPPTPPPTLYSTHETMVQDLRFWAVSELIRIMQQLPQMFTEMISKMTGGKVKIREELLPRFPQIQQVGERKIAVPPNVRIRH